MILIVMGASGSGKTTIGRLLAKQLNCGFTDADDFHSEVNKMKMHSGISLIDDDRWVWLGAIRNAIETKLGEGLNHVFACSALKNNYREILKNKDQDVVFIYLKCQYDVLKARVSGRKEHFFNPNLLDSQLQALEEPSENEAIIIDGTLLPDLIIDKIQKRLLILEKNKKPN